MNQIYQAAGVSKQAVSKHKKRQQANTNQDQTVVKIIEKTRSNHKRMGVRSIYHMNKDSMQMGRDKFESIAFSHGFKIRPKRNPMRTTLSQTKLVFDNKIAGTTITGINQVWQSDIFYLWVEDRFYYGIVIIDVFSRKLLALHVADNMQSKQLKIAVKKAIKSRAGYNLSGCIFHSDRGSQYIDAQHKEILEKKYKFQLSMCKCPQDNAYAERINGTIKNQYLISENLTKKNLRKEVCKAQWLYNNEKPHQNLINKLSPTEFEKYVERNVDKQKLELHISKEFERLSTEYRVINKEKSSKKEILHNT